MHRAKQIFPHLSRTKLILSSDVESLSLSFSLERTGGKRRVCESVWRRTRMIMVMDRGIFICEWREKLYVVGRRNVKREGGKAATERKNCNGLVTLFFFFFFLFFRVLPIYHADDDGGGRILDRDVLLPLLSSMSLRPLILLHFRTDVVFSRSVIFIIFFRFFFWKFREEWIIFVEMKRGMWSNLEFSSLCDLWNCCLLDFVWIFLLES